MIERIAQIVDRWSDRRFIGLLILGPVILCVIVYFQDRSLLLDSLNLSRNVYERSYFELLSPLDYEQSAPLLFLWLSKLVTSILGFSQYILRFVPLVAGLVAILLFAGVAVHTLGRAFGTVATLWLGTHQMYVRYATEYKQYMTDLLSTVIVLALLDRYPYLDRRSVWKVSIVGVLLIWLSMPGIFVLGALVVYYGYVHWRDRRSMWPVLGLGAALAVSFLVNYLLILVPTIESSHMQAFHDSFFIRADLTDGSAWSHNMGLVVSQARMIVGKSALAISSILILVLTAIGLAIQRRDAKMLVWALPIGAAYLASALGLYSILDRLMMYALPLIVMMAVYGLRGLWQADRIRSQMGRYIVLAILSVGLLIGFAARQGVKYVSFPFEQEDNRSAILHIAAHQDRDAYIVTSQHAYPAYYYYTELDIHYRDLELGASRTLRYEDDLLVEVKAQLEVNDKVWVLAQHQLDHQLAQLELDLKNIGTVEDAYRTKSAGAYLMVR